VVNRRPSDTGGQASETGSAQTLRWTLLIAVLLVVLQAGIGVAVNLYVAIPAHHPGASPANYFTGSFHSVVWAMSHGRAALAAHAVLGVGLAVFALGAAVQAVRVGGRSVAAWSVLGALLVIGAGFNGASFVDFNHDISSLIMAVLALAAIASYVVALFLVGQPPSKRPARLSATQQ